MNAILDDALGADDMIVLAPDSDEYAADTNRPTRGGDHFQAVTAYQNHHRSRPHGAPDILVGGWRPTPFFLKIMNKRNIVAISEQRDSHFKFVQPHLDRELIAIGPNAGMADQPMSYEFTQDFGLRVVVDNKLVENVGAVWYRKPWIDREYLSSINVNHQDFALSSLTNFRKLLYMQFQEAHWVSPYYALRQANNKAYQLSVAKQAGFRIPDTIITQNPVEAKAFIENHAATIKKTIASKMPVDKQGREGVIPTTKVEKTASLNGLRFTPYIFQERIERKGDLRVVVVGNQIFPAVKWNDQEADSRVYDSRLNKQTYEPYGELPEAIAKSCQIMRKDLGLEMGIFDLGIDPDDNMWFFEVNGNGMWLDVERETAMPIGKAMARLLMAGAGKTQSTLP